MKRCSSSYVIREVQIIATMRHHYTLIRVAKIQNTDSTKWWWRCWAPGILIHCWWDYKMKQPFWKTVWQFLMELNIHELLSTWPSNCTNWHLPKGVKMSVHTKTVTQMSITVLFIFTTTWKQLRQTSLGGQGAFRQWSIIHCYKEMQHQVKKSLEEI
jgi:hypothetical protein